MSDSEKDLLTTGEGVDEGSAASSAEGPGTGGGGGTGPAAGPDGGSAPPPAPPDDVETADSRKAHQRDIGQQLEVGEG